MIMPLDEQTNAKGKNQGFPNNMEPLHEEPSDKDKVKQIVETARNLCAQNKTCVEACDVLHWIEALKNDHAHIVKDVLDQSSSEARRLLVNGAFVYPKEEEYWWQFSIDACHYLLDGTIWSKPLVLAISCRSWKTLKLLLEGEHRASTDVFVRDDGNCNILHALIYSSRCSRPELEQQYVELYRYTMGTLDLETRRTLLMGENAAALRPLEVAVVTAQLDIARTIMDEVGVYRFNRDHVGMRREVWYDVTEYECWETSHSRRDRSPLELLSLLTAADVERDTADRFLRGAVIETWCSVKARMNRVPVMVWFVWRVCVTFCFYFLSPSLISDSSDSSDASTNHTTPNSTAPPPGPTCHDLTTLSFPVSFVYVAYAAGVLLYDVVELVLYVRRAHVTLVGVLRSPDYATHHGFYRLTVAVMMGTIILRSFLGWAPENKALTLLYTLNGVFAVWNLLFFLELIPGFGIMVISIQRMLTVMYRYTLLYTLLFFSFVYTFFMIFNLHGRCDYGYSGWIDSMYTTFLIMLNMTDVAGGFGRVDVVVALTHVLYVLLVSVLLLNFLIALMADANTRVSNVARNLERLQQVSAYLLVEERFGRVLARFQARRQRGFFRGSEGRLYLVALC